MKRKICVVTGSRAEYGLLYWVLRDIQRAPDLELQLVVTGMHLSSEFGSTSMQIENDGFEIHHRVEMLLSSDSAVGVTKSTGLGMIVSIVLICAVTVKLKLSLISSLAIFGKICRQPLCEAVPPYTCQSHAFALYCKS